MQSNSMRRQILLVIFVVSGFTGLIYESIWSHYLKLFLGHAAYAQTLVLAIFMGGMALGSFLVARYCSRIRQLLLGYVIVEAIIGLLGIVFHRLFVSVTDFSFASVIPAMSSGAAIHTYKWLLASLLILPQSTLLGMTFPLISGGIIRRWPERPGETLSMLYFTNSLGAALGVLVSGFVLMEAAGLPGTILTAGLLNIVLAFAVWTLVRKQGEPQPDLTPLAISSDSQASASSPQWFLIAAFLTGAASFLYEIGWIRMLSLVLGSSTHSFELMLSAFIFGLAFGGLWMRKRIDRVANPMRYLGVVMMIMGGLALLTLPAYNRTFDVIAWALKSFTPTEGGYLAFNVVGQAVAALIMIPTTFCAGMTLPLLTHALRRRSGEKAIGAVYASNTLGAIAGVIAAVHIGMPFVGVKGVIVAGAVIHMALGISGLMLTREARGYFRLASVAVCTVLVVSVVTGVTLDPLRLTSGVYRSGVAIRDSDARVMFLRDGKTATISVVQLPDGLVSIATNGKPDAAIQMRDGPVARDERTMIFAAALPLSMHPDPRRVANIGFGSGLTSHVLLTSDRVQRLDSIEIEPFMVEGAKLAYFPRVRRVFEDPRSHIVYEDAKTFFATAHEPYDVIVSEPSNPWVSGVATLFSDEFYRRVVGYLGQDGYFVQWLQIYETDMTIVASVIKALSPHFGDYAIYNADDTNVMIVATPGGKLQRPSATVFESPALKEELERMGVHSVADIERRRLADKHAMDALVRSYGSPANSDFFPFVDLNAPRLRFMRTSAGELTKMLVLPVPVVELLADHVIQAADSRPPANSDLERDLFTRRGKSVRSALEIGTINDIDLAVATSVMVVNATGELCNDSGARTTWSEAVHRISLSTSAFLSPGELDPMWQRIKTSSCYRGMAENTRAWIDLLETVARRDLDAIVHTGQNVLASRAWEPSLDKHAYAVTATAAALLRLGRNIEAQQLMERESAALRQPSEYKLALRTLAALSATQTREPAANIHSTHVTSVN